MKILKTTFAALLLAAIICPLTVAANNEAVKAYSPEPVSPEEILIINNNFTPPEAKPNDKYHGNHNHGRPRNIYDKVTQDNNPQLMKTGYRIKVDMFGVQGAADGAMPNNPIADLARMFANIFRSNSDSNLPATPPAALEPSVTVEPPSIQEPARTAPDDNSPQELLDIKGNDRNFRPSVTKPIKPGSLTTLEISTTSPAMPNGLPVRL